MKVPSVVFKTRVRDNSIEGDNPFKWEDKTTEDYFKGKRVILFSLPGAFTPTCSTFQLPNFEKLYNDFKEKGIDEIYCMSVNDSFVMNKWAQDQDIKNVKVIPDGNGEFTKGMDMLVNKNNLGFGYRSWRYAALIDTENIVQMFVEPGKEDNATDDPYGETSPENILSKLTRRLIL
jgi:peroxiredoxin